MITNAGLDLIKKYEGFSAQEYICPAGKRTIGYGHVCSNNEYYNFGINEEKAEELLLDDVSEAEKPIIKLLENTPLSSNQYDALVSLVYNIGINAFEDSTIKKKLLSLDYEGAANEFTRWIYSNGKPLKGLMKRRAEEKALFETE